LLARWRINSDFRIESSRRSDRRRIRRPLHPVRGGGGEDFRETFSRRFSASSSSSSSRARTLRSRAQKSSATLTLARAITRRRPRIPTKGGGGEGLHSASEGACSRVAACKSAYCFASGLAGMLPPHRPPPALRMIPEVVGQAVRGNARACESLALRSSTCPHLPSEGSLEGSHEAPSEKHGRSLSARITGDAFVDRSTRASKALSVRVGNFAARGPEIFTPSLRYFSSACALPSWDCREGEGEGILRAANRIISFWTAELGATFA